MAIASLNLPGYATPQSLDFSQLGQLGNVYKTASADANRQMTLAQLGQGEKIDPRVLLASGDMSLANLGVQIQNRQTDEARQAKQDEFQRSQAAQTQKNADRSFGLQQQQFAENQDYTPQERAKMAIEQGIQQGTPEFKAFVLTGKLPDSETAAPKIVPYGGSLVDSKGNVIMKNSSGTALLDDDTVKALAQQARAGDTSVYQNLGRGAQGAENIVKLRQEVAKQNAEAGVSGSEQALRNAEMMGVKAGQRTIGTKGANIEMAATEFNQILPVVQDASKAVQRTNYPDLNKILLAGQEKTGDPNVVKLGGGVNTLINLYARAISPSGVPTVSDKDHARELLSRAWSNNQFDAAVGMMQQEIAAGLKSPEKVRDEMRSRFLSGQGAAPVGYPAPGAQAAPLPQQGNVTSSGVKWSIQ